MFGKFKGYTSILKHKRSSTAQSSLKTVLPSSLSLFPLAFP